VRITPYIRKLIGTALREDIGSGDITTHLVIDPEKKATAEIIAKQKGILAGVELAASVFKSVAGELKVRALKPDGAGLRKGERILTVSGSARSILTAERTALNFLSHLSGIATLTDSYVRRIRNTRAAIYDTRKTTPLLRILEKYAVRQGGGKNHRFGLFDQILIKNNHIKVAGTIPSAVSRARRGNKKRLKLEVETGNLNQVRQALQAGADRIMLDNMPLSEMNNAVRLIRESKRNVVVEASGRVTLRNVRAIAGTRVDVISVGSLTHSAPALDFSLKIIRIK
jgi:nicotinate-nucleotide pyrophosphorylase (carboxylating)